MSKELAAEIIDSLKNHSEDWILFTKNNLHHKLYRIDVDLNMYNMVWGRRGGKYQSIKFSFFNKIKIIRAAESVLKKLQVAPQKISDFEEK